MDQINMDVGTITVLANGQRATHTRFINLSWVVGELYRMAKRGCKAKLIA